MADRTLIVGGLVIDPARKLEAVRDVLIENGEIRDVAAGLSKKSALAGAPRVDAKGQWVIPGLVDMHVHLREPGREGDEKKPQRRPGRFGGPGNSAPPAEGQTRGRWSKQPNREQPKGW